MIEALSNKLPSYLPLPDFAKIVHLTVAEVKSKIDAGEIAAATINDQVIIPYREMDKLLPRESLPEYLEFAHLKGVGIGMAQAEKKYGVAQPNFSRWVKRELIRVIGSDPDHSQRILMDESDVAYCTKIYRRNKGTGRRVFNPDGTPYKIKFIRTRNSATVSPINSQPRS